MLSAMLSLLVAAAVALFVIVVAALATPIKIGVSARTSPSWRLQIAARLFGGLTPPIPIHDSARPRRERKRRAPKKKQPVLSRRAAARIPRVIAASPSLLAGLLRPVHLERLAVDADVGLADPADTGHLFGLLAAANYARPPNSAVSIAVRPDFTGPRAAGELDAVVSFVPVAFLPAGLRFAWRVFGPAS